MYKAIFEKLQSDKDKAITTAADFNMPLSHLNTTGIKTSGKTGVFEPHN
jgi:hypothetical protein